MTRQASKQATRQRRLDQFNQHHQLHIRLQTPTSICDNIKGTHQQIFNNQALPTSHSTHHTSRCPPQDPVRDNSPPYKNPCLHTQETPLEYTPGPTPNQAPQRPQNSHQSSHQTPAHPPHPPHLHHSPAPPEQANTPLAPPLPNPRTPPASTTQHQPTQPPPPPSSPPSAAAPLSSRTNSTCLPPPHLPLLLLLLLLLLLSRKGRHHPTTQPTITTTPRTTTKTTRKRKRTSCAHRSRWVFEKPKHLMRGAPFLD